MIPNFCNSVNTFLVLNICATQRTFDAPSNQIRRSDNLEGRFETVFQWNYLNYTWTSLSHYSWAVSNEIYIPENNAPTGIKIYKDKIYISVPRFRKGIPATLTFIPKYSIEKYNPLLVPFPSWEANEMRSCGNLQSVQSMEIDTKGIMWVLDGVQINGFNRCPPKLLFLDLNRGGKLIHSFVFPQEVCLQDGGFLNDIVVDETDGDFAYITDNSQVDPGLIVYSRWKNRAWKLRDSSMFPEPNAINFVVENTMMNMAGPIDGIALSPKLRYQDKTLFFCSISGFRLFSISTSILKNEGLYISGKWRQSVKTVGYKVGQSDGLMADNAGNLYFTLLPQYGVGKWNIREDFLRARMVDQNRREMVWPDTFAMDQMGYLYLVANKIYKYINPNTTLSLMPDTQFRILRLYTGTRSYLYS